MSTVSQYMYVRCTQCSWWGWSKDQATILEAIVQKCWYIMLVAIPHPVSQAGNKEKYGWFTTLILPPPPCRMWSLQHANVIFIMSVGDTFKCTTNLSSLVVNRKEVRYNCSNEILEPSLVPRLHFRVCWKVDLALVLTSHNQLILRWYFTIKLQNYKKNHNLKSLTISSAPLIALRICKNLW